MWRQSYATEISVTLTTTCWLLAGVKRNLRVHLTNRSCAFHVYTLVSEIPSLHSERSSGVDSQDREIPMSAEKGWFISKIRTKARVGVFVRRVRHFRLVFHRGLMEVGSWMRHPHVRFDTFIRVILEAKPHLLGARSEW